MKKQVCKKSGWLFVSFIFSIFGMMHLFGITYWTRFGWEEPNTMSGIYYIVLAFIIFIGINYFCKEPHTLKCISCKEVFDELKTKNRECPNCKGKLVSVDEYYQESNKYEETQ